MTTTDFKAKLRARAPLLGCFVKTPHPAVVEALSGAGLDCICLDAEHAPFDRGDLDACLLAARAGGLPALVRTPSGAAHEILAALDMGAAGVVAPHVRSADEARAVARAGAYGPGGRGFAGAVRGSASAAQSIGERLAEAAAQTTIVVQIEDVEAIDRAGEIAAVEGIDAIFVGRMDLTVALGESDPKSERALAAVKTVLAACLAQGRAVGMFTPDIAEVPSWRAQGASLFLLGSDQGFLRAGAARLRAEAGFGGASG